MATKNMNLNTELQKMTGVYGYNVIPADKLELIWTELRRLAANGHIRYFIALPSIHHGETLKRECQTQQLNADVFTIWQTPFLQISVAPYECFGSHSLGTTPDFTLNDAWEIVRPNPHKLNESPEVNDRVAAGPSLIGGTVRAADLVAGEITFKSKLSLWIRVKRFFARRKII